MAARPDDGTTHPLDLGTAGASARREHARRRANRIRRTRERHPIIGGALLAVRGEPSHERVWARGAAAEERLARALARRLDPGVLVLHDRRVPRSRANIDHIAVASSGVWVIDTKSHRGRVAVRTPWLGEARLIVAGRDRTRLVDGLARQVELVGTAMAGIAPDVPVHGALCFVDADLPLLSTPSLRGVAILSPRRLARRLNADGPLGAGDVRAVAAALAERFPPA
jgi:hypothetical protein